MMPKRNVSAHPMFTNLPRGTSEPGQSPNNQFVHPDQIAQNPWYQFDENKIWLGIINGEVHKAQLEHDRISQYVLGGQPIGISTDYHHTTVAGTRSGKGRAAIIPTLLTYQGSCLVIDIKGELASITAERRKKMGQTVHVIDPFGVADVDEAYRRVFNPIDMLADKTNKTVVEDTELIAESLITESGGDQHWDESARAIFTACALYVATHDRFKGQRNLIKVREILLRLNEPNSKYRQEMEDSDAANNAVKFGAWEFWDKTAGEQQSVLSTVRRHLRFLGYSAMQSVLEGGGVDIADLKKRPTTIYLCLPALRMNSCGRWFRLFVNLALAAIERTPDNPKLPVLFVLDEANVLGTMNSLQIAAGQLAGFGVKLWTIWQSIGQIKANYDKQYEAFLSGVLQFFGNSDLETLEWVSKRLGSTTIDSATKSEVSLADATGKGLGGIAIANQVQSLMGPEEISVYFGRDDEMVRQLIIYPSSPPIIVQRAYYDKHEYLRSFIQ